MDLGPVFPPLDLSNIADKNKPARRCGQKPILVPNFRSAPVVFTGPLCEPELTCFQYILCLRDAPALGRLCYG